MDEVLIANFMLFQDAVVEGGYDLVVADEAWDVDHYWHEHPELKRRQLAWLTDFVGYVPMPSGGGGEALLTTDYNAEMIEHVERHPSVRDRSIFVGNPDDIIPLGFGKELPDDARLGAATFRIFRLCHRTASRRRSGRRAELRRSLGYPPTRASASSPSADRASVATSSGASSPAIRW